MDLYSVSVLKLAKLKERAQTSFVKKGFIVWLSGKFFLRDTAGNPELARELHLARSGSQFILAAHRASHIVNAINTDGE